MGLEYIVHLALLKYRPRILDSHLMYLRLRLPSLQSGSLEYPHQHTQTVPVRHFRSAKQFNFEILDLLMRDPQVSIPTLRT